MERVNKQEEIFAIKSASISQCERSDSFLLTYEDEELTFRLCDLYAFRKTLMSFDIVELLDPNAPDVEIIYLPNCDRFLLLTLKQILQFRELLNGTFNTLALNSSIQKILRRNVFNF
ncbi:MAG: hypothetical protein AAF616_08905 [Bacteroidota bacterium]